MSRTLDKQPIPKKSPSTRADEPTPRRRESMRDFVEQIVIAFILAFLVRGFEAEAFVIPTGSMAPTLMGMHKEVACPYCGYVFTVNAAEEMEPRAGLNLAPIMAGLCGNCHAPVRIDEDPSFNGDRILVMKFLYNMPFVPRTSPERWSVVVFHYPEEPETNYIKRLVGLPDEDLRIYFGDVLTRPRGTDEPFRLRRKPLMHQEAMQMNVWDDRNRSRALASLPEWQRWQPREPGAWSEKEPGHFAASATEGWVDLRYRHLVPDLSQWEAILAGNAPATPPRPSLISDFYAYNAWGANLNQLRNAIPPHWVGDLTLSCRLESKSDTGLVKLELVEAGVSNRCEIDLSTGLATLYHGDQALGEPVATAVKGKGGHDLAFANVDGRLTLWVDGGTPFNEGVVYEDGSEYTLGGHPIPTAADLDPVGVSARGADVEVSGLVLKRDIYYTLDPGAWDYGRLGLSSDRQLDDPREFSLLAGLEWRDFSIKPGHYMMLGDNSPRSKDGRGWGLRDRDWDPRERESWEVPEALLIGKAFFVYWPHGKPFWPNIAINRNFHLPFRPYVERMKWIR